MADTVLADIFMAYIFITDVFMVYLFLADIVMTYLFIADVVMALQSSISSLYFHRTKFVRYTSGSTPLPHTHIVMALCSYGPI